MVATVEMWEFWAYLLNDIDGEEYKQLALVLATQVLDMEPDRKVTLTLSEREASLIIDALQAQGEDI